MATLLNTDASGLNDMASKYKTIYPIASRCGVFAKSDLQPLINDGAAKEDLAASIFNAVATQTISGLACGRPIRGNVIFLGGPLFFMSELREAFKRILQERVSRYIIPENAHLYVAYGAAIMFGKIRRTYPEANIVSIDYDPGASEANQLNRIKLMIAAAKKPGDQQKLSQNRKAAVESQAAESTDLDAGQAVPVQDQEKVLESL